MTDLKKITPTKILWIDLEMTGLDPKQDRIVEVAAIVTDWDFNELDFFESGVGQDLAEITPRFENEFYAQFPENKKALLKLTQTSPAETEVEQKVMSLVAKHFADGPALLAGNSIHQDRRFIQQWWPGLDSHLHYRMLDVSAWKVVMAGKYGVEFQKGESHRALDDIRESIAELKFYLEKVEC